MQREHAYLYEGMNVTRDHGEEEREREEKRKERM
jgi:hypothetical protein